MKLALIMVAVIAVLAIAFEIVLRLIARRERKCFESMSPEEQRKHQEAMHKAQTWVSSR